MKTMNTCWIYIQPRKFIITTIKYTTSRKDNTLENFVKIKFWGNKFIITYCFSLTNLKKYFSVSHSLSLSLSQNYHPLSKFSHHSLEFSLSLTNLKKKKKNPLSLSLRILSLSLKENFFILSQRVNFSLSQRNYVSNQYWNWSCPTSKMEIQHHQFWRGAIKVTLKKLT